MMKLIDGGMSTVLLIPMVLLVGCPADKPGGGTPGNAPATPAATHSPASPSESPAATAGGPVPRGENHLQGFDAGVLQFTDQGSGFFPMKIVRALKDDRTGRPFLENLERFGLVPGEKSARNPEGLPVGIVTNLIKHEGDGRTVEMFGFTCAACHTSDLHYQGKTVRVDGSSGLFYVDALGDRIGDSLEATLKDPDELIAFLRRYVKIAQFPEDQIAMVDKFAEWANDSKLGAMLRAHLKEHSEDMLARLKGEKPKEQPPEAHASVLSRIESLPAIKSIFGGLAEKEKELADSAFPDLAGVMSDLENLVYRLKFLKVRGWLSSDPAHRLAAGYGRADDFGTARVELFGEWNAGNMKPVNAPVSVPPLWNVNKMAWLHWNANTNSVIQRSIGEALGVGATYNKDSFETSVAIVNQMKIEEQVHKVTAPVWPAAIFGAPDPAKVERGKTLYRNHCAQCHDPTDVDEKGLVAFKLFTLDEVGTDRGDAENFDRPVIREDGSTVGFAASIKDLLDNLVAKAREGLSPEDKALLDRLEQNHTPTIWRDTLRETGGPVYPARPLEGAWATAPYLHNGSVPTLYHLLFPEERPVKFPVGQKDFDPDKVGFEIAPAKITPQRDLDLFEFDTNLPGNMSTGHSGKTYGTELPREDRLALIEYLKVHRDTWPSR